MFALYEMPRPQITRKITVTIMTKQDLLFLFIVEIQGTVLKSFISLTHKKHGFIKRIVLFY